MSTSGKLLPIAVVGAGFSGTMTALHLLTRLPADRPILLCERWEAFARGLAYATGNPDHLLNLRAANMSAYPDRPDHFEVWLAQSTFGPEERAGIRSTPAGTFAARGLFGRYLTELLTQTLTTSGGASRLVLVPDAVIDLEPEAGGYRLHTGSGRSYVIAGAVLAMGNLGGRSRPKSRFWSDPWSSGDMDRLRPDSTVLIAGTGLTMIDAVATLRHRGFQGPVVALSRRGLLPNSHAPTQARALPTLTSEIRLSLPRLLAAVRSEIASAEAAGEDWRGVIDALRPITNALWLDLPRSEQARFLRHLRPFWDVHRHRSAPPVAAMIADEIAAGTLIVQAARIVSIADQENEAIVTVRLRGVVQPTTLQVQRILDATGFGRLSETEDPLVGRLLSRGLVRAGPHGLGLDIGPDYRITTSTTGRLWALGPLLRGILWECTAVPDIRNEASDLAKAIAAELSPIDLTLVQAPCSAASP